MHPDVLKAWNVKEKNVFYAQTHLPSSYEKAVAQLKYTPVSEFPSVTRDFSLAIKEEVSFQQIKDVALDNGGDLLHSISFNELYLGDKIPQGQRGVLFSLEYKSSKRTLREDEVNLVNAQIEKALMNRLDVVRR